MTVAASATHYTPEQVTPKLFLTCQFPEDRQEIEFRDRH